MGSKRRPTYLLYHWFWSSLDWIYPPHCGGCGLSGSRWCLGCFERATRLQPPFCQRCGVPGSGNRICRQCRREQPAFTAVRSWGVFAGPVQNALHRLKYRRDLGLGEALATYMVEMLENLGWDVDLVVPVPLGAQRKLERGYNQVALLALPLALSTGLVYRPRALKRVRDTQSQVGLSIPQRLANVAGAFQAHPSGLAGRSILLVDDVMTTGATLDASARALLDAGGRGVYGLTFARAVPDTPLG